VREEVKEEVDEEEFAANGSGKFISFFSSRVMRPLQAPYSQSAV
jgi:hypothetical protein